MAPALIPQDIAQVHVRLGQIRLERDRAVARGDRPVELTLIRQRNPEVVVGLGIIGPERDRPAIRGNRKVGFSRSFSATARLLWASA